MTRAKPRTQKAPDHPATQAHQDHVNFAYLNFLRWECECFGRAIEGINASFHGAPRPSGTAIEAGFGHIQSALGFAANIAKMLWFRGLAQEAAVGEPRAARLRKLVGVTNDPVLNDVHLRNDFEHLDARVDAWVEKSTNHNFLLHMVGADHHVVGIDIGDRFTRYDPATNLASMRHHSVNLDELSKSIMRVHTGATKEIQDIQHRRWPTAIRVPPT